MVCFLIIPFVGFPLGDCCAKQKLICVLDTTGKKSAGVLKASVLVRVKSLLSTSS